MMDFYSTNTTERLKTSTCARAGFQKWALAIPALSREGSDGKCLNKRQYGDLKAPAKHEARIAMGESKPSAEGHPGNGSGFSETS